MTGIKNDKPQGHRGTEVHLIAGRTSVSLCPCGKKGGSTAAPILRRRGFTLVEALAALLLIAIVLPVVMRGVTVASRAASSARRNTEAASLAQSKLNELLATEQWRNGYLAGRFQITDGDTAPDYTWSAETLAWREPYVRQLNVYVAWTSAGSEQRVAVSTLVYEGNPEREDATEDEETDAGTGGAQ